MKKTLAVMLLICLLAVLPSTLAEGLETTEGNLPSAPAEKLELNVQIQYMPSIKPLPGTGLVVIESKKDNTLGVFSSEGKALIPYGLSAVNALGNGFLSVAEDNNTLNGLAIYKTDGTKVSDFSYGSVTVYGSRWVAGIVLADAANGEKDLTVNNADYLIGRLDLYYVSEGSVSLTASLDRQQFANAKQHGDYISIQNRAGETTAYDRDFNPVLTQLKDVKASYYKVENNQIISLITNEEVAYGYTEAAEADLPERMLLIASVTGMDGTKYQAILDTDGNELMPAEYTIVALGDPYVVVTNDEGLRGLYSLAEQRLVVPCEFTGIIACATSVDQYVNNGYVCVEKDGKRGFVDASTGAVTCPTAYNSRIAKVYGSSIVFDGESGFVLIAGDGTRTDLYEYDDIPAVNGDGFLLVAKKNGFYGVIDWHGNELLPFIHKSIITLTYDSKALIRTSTGFELDVITAR